MSRSITRQAIADEAAKRGWSIELISQFDKSLYVITDDKGRSSIGRGGRFMDASMHGREISINKHLSYAYIERLGYKLLPHIVYDEPIEAFQFLHTHAPIVVKPIDAEQSKGVTVDIVQDDQLASALVEAKRYSLNGNVLLQAQVEGKLYRILVVNGKYFAAAYRRPAFVVGDGVLTIEALIADKNKDPLRSKDGPTPLKTIPIEDARALLGEVRLREVLPAGEICEVSSIASISRGGEAEDVTDIVNPFYRTFAEHISKELKLPLLGIDLIVEDISQDHPAEATLPLIEINSLPGFKLHLFPTAGGQSRDPSPLILDALFDN